MRPSKRRKCADEGRGIQSSDHPTISESGNVSHHAKQHNHNKRRKQAKQAGDCSNTSTTLETILLKYLPAQENIFKHLKLKDLLSMSQVSSTCRDAVHFYLGGVKTINDNKGQFVQVGFDELKIILPFTRSLQVFTSKYMVDDGDYANVFMNNPKLRVFSAITIPQFDIYLTRSTSKLESLCELHLARRVVEEKMNDEDVPKFFKKLAEFCPKLSHLWIHSQEVLNDESLSTIGRLPLLRALTLIATTISGRLSSLLSNCPSLRRIDIEDCTIAADTLLDVSQHSGNLEHYAVKLVQNDYRQNDYRHNDYDDDDDIPEYITEATNIVLANSKLKSLHLIINGLDTFDDQVFDTMTAHLEDVTEVSFNINGEFSKIQFGFTRFVKRFQNLSSLTVSADYISQNWLNVIASNCSNLEYLHLIGFFSKPRDDEADIIEICKQNTKLKHVVVGIKRNISRESCRSLTRLNLKYLCLNFYSDVPLVEFEEMLSRRFEGVVRDETERLLEVPYKPTDAEASFLYSIC